MKKEIFELEVAADAYVGKDDSGGGNGPKAEIENDLLIAADAYVGKDDSGGGNGPKAEIENDEIQEESEEK